MNHIISISMENITKTVLQMNIQPEICKYIWTYSCLLQQHGFSWIQKEMIEKSAKCTITVWEKLFQLSSHSSLFVVY